jgi:hypothetical protein
MNNVPRATITIDKLTPANVIFSSFLICI